MIIGITGTYGAGKDTVAQYLVTKGFNHYSLSDEIREILRELGIEETRENLIKVGNQFRKERGNDHWAIKVMEKLQRPAVVTSLRHPNEIEHLKKQSNFILLHVDAERNIRYQRSVLRARTGDVMTFKEFVEKEERELFGSANEQNLSQCFARADYIIYNNSGLRELTVQIDNVIEKMVNEGA